MSAEQVIIQVWISTRFGVLSEQVPVADECFRFIKATFAQPGTPCKAHSPGGAGDRQQFLSEKVMTPDGWG
jgi:hypothetical protein